eukprot:765096-Hanusia_phi.AAC.7
MPRQLRKRSSKGEAAWDESGQEAKLSSSKRAIGRVVNEFYDAMETGDIGGMMKLWRKADYVKYSHDSSKLVMGYDKLHEFWLTVFAHVLAMVVVHA